MRSIYVVAACVLVTSGPAFAQQEWTEYSSKADLYTIAFPGEPKIQEITYMSEFGYALPARVYSAEHGRERYSTTVVDYRDVEKPATAKSQQCPAGAETCIGNNTVGLGYWKMDVAGANEFAVSRFLQRDAKLTHFMWNNTDLVAGHQLQMTNRDGSRTFVAVYMHDNRLYILEGTTPKGAPEPGLFQQSLGFLDAQGQRVRYQGIYYNVMPAPPRTAR